MFFPSFFFITLLFFDKNKKEKNLQLVQNVDILAPAHFGLVDFNIVVKASKF